MQNLHVANPRLQGWVNYPGNQGAVVTAVYEDSRGQVRVDVLLTRFGIPLRFLLSQTPYPSVGDVGFVTVVDQRRDTPIFVGVRSAVSALMSATVESVNQQAGTVDVTLNATGRRINRIAWVGARVPETGEQGVVSFLDGRSDRPVYLGSLSVTTETVPSLTVGESLDWQGPTTSSALSSGSASVLPSYPSGYLTVEVDGAQHSIPYY
jgi:hypothetical protein